MSQILDAPAFLDALEAETVRTGAEARVPLAETEDGRAITLPVKLLRRPDGSLRKRPLIVVFHGAIDQEKRGFPYFEGAYALTTLAETDAIVLSLADPSLWLSKSLTAAWYAANRYGDMPQAIHELILAVAGILDPARVILTGSSTGAHAALVQSARLEGCVCIACNPITRISAYYARKVEGYLATCWGREARGGGRATLPAGVLDDCGTLYRDGHGHALVVLQNATDPHLLRQAVAFAAQIRDPERLLFLSEFYPGSIGHVLPRVVTAQWLLAATRAPAADCLEIARAYGEAPGPAGAASAASLASADIDLAARISAAARQR